MSEKGPALPVLTPVEFSAHPAQITIMLADESKIVVDCLVTSVALAEGMRDQFGHQGYSITVSTVPHPVVIPGSLIRRRGN